MISYEAIGVKDAVHEAETQLAFEKELKDLINRHSQENGSNTPDWILAEYLHNCLKAWNYSTGAREAYYGRVPEPVPLTDCPTEPPK